LPILIIFTLTLFYFYNNYIYFKLDNVPPLNDQAHHLTNRDYFINFFKSFNLKELKPYTKDCYPPFFYICGAFFYFLTGNNILSCIITNSFFYLILLISIFFIGKKILDYKLGIIACLVISLYPYIYAATRVFLIDFALTSIVTLSICLMVYSNEFSNVKMAILFGVTCLLGMLTKQSFFFYICGPLIFNVVTALKLDSAKIKNLFIIFIIGLFIPLLYSYLFWFKTVNNLFKTSFQGVYFVPQNGWTAIFYYFKILPDQITWLFLIVFIFSILIYIFHKDYNKNILLSWFLLPNIFLSLIPIKDTKYTLPLLPAIALISAWGICYIKNLKAKIFLLVFFIAYGVCLQYLLLFRINIALKINNEYFNKLLSFAPPYKIRPYGEYTHVPRHNNWAKLQDEILSSLKQNMPQSKNEINIGIADYTVATDSKSIWFIPKLNKFTDNYHILNEWGIRYLITEEYLPFKIILLNKLEKIINWSSDSFFGFLLIGDSLDNIFPDLNQYYKLIKITKFYDGSYIYLYLRK